MRQTTQLLKALTDETRLRLLALLSRGELCVCDLIEVLQVPQSTVSRHLAILKHAGWVIDRRQGIWMYYRLAGQEGMPLQISLLSAILAHLTEATAAQKDLARLDLYLMGKSQDACS